MAWGGGDGTGSSTIVVSDFAATARFSGISWGINKMRITSMTSGRLIPLNRTCRNPNSTKTFERC